MADVVEGPQRAVSESGGGRRSGDGTVFTRTRFLFLQKKLLPHLQSRLILPKILYGYSAYRNRISSLSTQNRKESVFCILW